MSVRKETVTAKSPTKKVVKKKTAANKTPAAVKTKVNKFERPLVASAFMSDASSRTRSYSGGVSNFGGERKRLASELHNIDSGITPFESSDGGVDVKEAIELCRKAYWNVSVFRMTIDIMTEFSNSKIHWRGGDQNAVKFFNTWYPEALGWKFNDQYFREYFRGGSMFIQRLDSKVSSQELRKMTRTASIDSGPVQKTIPIKYLMLDAANIKCDGNAGFDEPTYSKVLNSYEISKLKSPKTPAEKAFKAALHPDTKTAIDNGGVPTIPLDIDKVTAVFCKKQDYEPMAVPMFFPVLFDINLKLQFKKAEAVIAKAVDYCILLITMGAEPDKGGVDQALVDSMNDLFSTESVGRVLVSDYTTKMDFVIPDLNKILGSQKYEVVDRDINSGLLNIFFGEDKFANAMIKIDVFLERLKEAREAYLEGFLLPEVKRLSRELGFRNPPVPEFEEVDLKDDVEYYKVYNRLAEIGLLTPDETFEAYRSNKLPTKSDSEKNQKEFLKQKDEGFYAPIERGGKNGEVSGESGRPSGGTNKVSQNRKTSPIGASSGFSLDQIKNAASQIDTVISKVESSYKKKNSIKRMSKDHKKRALSLATYMMSNIEIENWSENIENALAGKISFNPDLNAKFEEILSEHDVKDELGVILLANSGTDLPKEV